MYVTFFGSDLLRQLARRFDHTSTMTAANTYFVLYEPWLLLHIHINIMYRYIVLFMYSSTFCSLCSPSWHKMFVFYPGATAACVIITSDVVTSSRDSLIDWLDRYLTKSFKLALFYSALLTEVISGHLYIKVSSEGLLRWFY